MGANFEPRKEFKKSSEESLFIFLFKTQPRKSRARKAKGKGYCSLRQ
jgi:hypothetical protein